MSALHTARLGRVDPGPGYGKSWAYTTDQTLTAEQDGGVVSNFGATVPITLTLPPMLAGMEYVIESYDTFGITFMPNGTDTIDGEPAGTPYYVSGLTTVVFACSVSGSVRVIIGREPPQLRTVARYVDLSTFRSRYAHQGEGIQWPTFSSSLSLSDSSNHLTQAQRRKNWRIFMEACLYANGGTGEFDGKGWYTITQSDPAGNASAGGTVFVPGPLMIEPYDDSEYAPNWTGDGATQRYWTLPGGLNLRGNGISQGDTATVGWQEVNPKGSRIICWNNAVGWWPIGGPELTGTATRKQVSNWSWDELSVMRKGTIAGSVFRARHWSEDGSTTHLNQHWHIGKILIECQPLADGVVNTGAEIRCGLASNVDFMRIMCHQNAGWGWLYTGNFLPDGTRQSASTTVNWNQVMVHGSGKGAAMAHAYLMANVFNLEQSSGQTSSASRFVIGEGCDDVQITKFWGEGLRPVGSGTDAGLVVWEPVATCVSEGILEAGVTATDGTVPHVTIGSLIMSGSSGDVLGSGVEVHRGHVVIGDITASYLTTLFTIDPNESDETASIEYDSARTVTSNVTAMLSHEEFGTVELMPFKDRASLPYSPPWITPVADANFGNTAYGSRYWNKGLGANSTNRLPVGADAYIGKRITLMRYDPAYTLTPFPAAGKTITAATQANPCQLTVTGHGFTTGQQKWVTAVGGMVELNNRYLTITVLDANTITLNGVNSTAYTPYTTGGVLGGQFIANEAAGVGPAIAEPFVAVTYEYLGQDRWGVVDGFEALA